MVVGGGFSGCLFSVHLLRLAGDQPISITVFDRSEKPCRGVAFSTDNPLHLMNVPGNAMSAFPDDPDHFVAWVAKYAREVNGGGYVPRHLYGDYLESIFRTAMDSSGGRLKYEHAEVVEVRPSGQGSLVVLADGREVPADIVVLAIGNYPPANPTFITDHILQSGRYISDPWRQGAVSQIGHDDSILIIGTGLTMVDKVVELRRAAHTGPITAVSRRGLLPLPHDPSIRPADLKLSVTKPVKLRALAKMLRKAVSQSGQAEDWRSVIDGLRPYSQEVWQAMPLKEKRRFLNHIRPFWEIVRHRIPPAAQIVVSKMVESGQLKTLAASIVRIVPKEHGAWVWLMTPKSGHSQPIDVDWIINCSGSGPDFRRRTDPLTLQLFDAGHAAPTEIGFGLMASAKGEIIDRYGKVRRNLLTLGPPLKGLLWESTGIPELRVQASVLASHVAKLLRLVV